MSQPAPDETTAGASPVSRTREEEIARMAKHAEEVQKKYPGTDLKLDQKWWLPSIDFHFQLKVSENQCWFCGMLDPAPQYGLTTPRDSRRLSTRKLSPR